MQRASSEDDSGATLHADSRGPVGDRPATRRHRRLGAAGFVWWTQTVPAKRLEVSRSKKSGEISDLLDELDEANREAEGQPTAGDKRVERWLLTDWREPSRRKEPALPMLPKSKFNSGDNPILAAAALILSFGVANALAERASSLL